MAAVACVSLFNRLSHNIINRVLRDVIFTPNPGVPKRSYRVGGINIDGRVVPVRNQIVVVLFAELEFVAVLSRVGLFLNAVTPRLFAVGLFVHVS